MWGKDVSTETLLQLIAIILSGDVSGREVMPFPSFFYLMEY